MSEIPCAQPFDDGTHCEEPRGHHLSPIARQHIAQARAELAKAREAETAAKKPAEQHQPETEESSDEV